MTDRENVIKRLEECLSASCRGFRTCPYSDDEWDAVKTALALLREQEPMKPIKEPLAGSDYSISRCGECKAWLRITDRYCGRCGRAVKWDD